MILRSRVDSYTSAASSSPTHTDGLFREEQDTERVSERQAAYDWLPLTLRSPYLAILVTTTVCLSALVFYLTVKSSRDHGISDDNNSALTFSSWRFLPMLIATVYSLLVATTVNDVRRTEISARLSRPRGASAAHTICMPTRSWWNDLCDAWSKKKNGGERSWALLSASVINLLALLVVSPLPAILLFLANTQFTALTDFNKMHEVQNLITTPAANEMVTFRTTIAAVLKVPLPGCRLSMQLFPFGLLPSVSHPWQP